VRIGFDLDVAYHSELLIEQGEQTLGPADIDANRATPCHIFLRE
jgi:hypothetical protein